MQSECFYFFYNIAITKVAYFSKTKLTPWSRLLLEKLRTIHLYKKFPALYEI
jgi:hypothetical protein